MPYIDPDEQRQDTTVRFPGDPFPQPVRHNRFDRREQPTAEILGATGLYGQAITETDVLMAAPGDTAVAANESYGELVDDTYESALKRLTDAQASAWALECDGCSQREIALQLGITKFPVTDRLRRARQRLSSQLDWVITPELKAKYRKPKPAAKPRPIAWTLLMQQIGAELAKSDNDDQARWRLARLLTKAIDVGMSPTDLVRRTGIVPNVLAQLVSDFRNG